MSKDNHKRYLDLSISEARKGYGFVSPNPMVGAVLVKDNMILETGYHKVYGGNHAEVDLLDKVLGVDLSKCVLYVTLEPCCHYGKTSPCVDRIINSGLKHVVVGCLDPNPSVSGKGVQALKEAGLNVEVINYKPCIDLNYIYNKYMLTGNPYITLKLAITLDGYIADKRGFSKYITGEKSRFEVMQMRAGYDAILVGRNTLVSDNPHLGVREFECRRDPLRILLSSQFKGVDLSSDYKFFRDENFVVGSSIHEVLGICNERGVSSILVEGGAGVFTSFINSGLVDDMHVFIANKILGESHIKVINDLNIGSLSESLKMNLVDLKMIDNDVLARYSFNN